MLQVAFGEDFSLHWTEGAVQQERVMHCFPSLFFFSSPPPSYCIYLMYINSIYPDTYSTHCGVIGRFSDQLCLDPESSMHSQSEKCSMWCNKALCLGAVVDTSLLSSQESSTVLTDQISEDNNTLLATLLKRKALLSNVFN